jgi:hypothetical protein
MEQNTQEEGKRGRGRPKLEDTMTPEWYKIILDAGKEGKHITQFLIELGISWQGHSRLLKTNKKYNEAVQEYEKLCEEYWYNMAHTAMTTNGGNGFNSRLWSLIVRNKFSSRWSEASKIDVTTQGEKIDNSVSPLQIEIIRTKMGQDENTV